MTYTRQRRAKERLGEEPISLDLYAYVCPYCGRQYRAPGGHHVAGDDCATSCFHRHPGERGVTQPRLVRIRVVPAEPFKPQPVPHDRPITHASYVETESGGPPTES